MKTEQTRRHVLLNTAKGALGLFAAATVGPIILSACKKNDSAGKPTTNNSGDASQPTSCPNQEALSEQDKTVRASLKYVDKTPLPGRTCDNCKLYTLPQAGALCGGCKVVPGPIHPKGYCTAWIARM